MRVDDPSPRRTKKPTRAPDPRTLSFRQSMTSCVAVGLTSKCVDYLCCVFCFCECCRRDAECHDGLLPDRFPSSFLEDRGYSAGRSEFDNLPHTPEYGRASCYMPLRSWLRTPRI